MCRGFDGGLQAWVCAFEEALLDDAAVAVEHAGEYAMSAGKLGEQRERYAQFAAAEGGECAAERGVG
ncbi:MAG TPA: hypothetical protein VFN67_17295, partial [Polyangiales bacterium]|nr:hypothetical protein [Polyangiales bacterium]